MTAKVIDDRIAKLNDILFQDKESHHTSEDSVVVLRNLTKAKTSINSIQDFFQPHKLRYVRIFEEPDVGDEFVDLNLRKFNISGPKTPHDNSAPQTPSSKTSVSVLIEFDHTEDLEPYFEKLVQVPNPFGGLKISIESMNNSKVNKKESHNLLNSPSKILYDSIVIENINEFFGETKLSMRDFEDFLSKFKFFGDIEAIYFPTKSKGDDQSLDFKSVGFIGFAHKSDLNESTLKCLYFLHNLDLDTFNNFTESDITDISSEPINEPSETSPSARLQLSICQKKHEPFLFNNETGIKLSDGALELFEASGSNGSLADEATYQRFSKNINFQQSNIYVNTLPIVFQNDDSAWFDFWIQFGTKDSIKSAKIIKPQFYSRRQNSPFGKFGFVFYNDLKPALKAILLTNNRLVSGFADYPKFHIEASFAIQKSTSERLLNTYSGSPLRQDSYMMPFSYAPQVQPLLPPPLQPPLQHNSPLNYPMPVYDGYGYYAGRGHMPGAGQKRRSKSLSGNPTESPTPYSTPPPQMITPYENYYNYYMAMPYPVQADFAPNCAPTFAPAPFHNELYAYNSQYGYYPFPYPGHLDNLPKTPRRTSE